MGLEDDLEEMAAAYGKTPEELLEMPWTVLKEWLRVARKRMRRQLAWGAILASVSAGLGFGGGGGSSLPPEEPDADLDLKLARLGLGSE